LIPDSDNDVKLFSAVGGHYRRAASCVLSILQQRLVSCTLAYLNSSGAPFSPALFRSSFYLTSALYAVYFRLLVDRTNGRA